MKAKFEMEVGRCPMCGDYELDFGANKMIDNIIRYSYICSNCGFNGAEDYSLTFVGHIAYDDGIQLLENPDYKHFIKQQMQENYRNYLGAELTRLFVCGKMKFVTKDLVDIPLTYKQFAESLEADVE